MLAKLLVTYNHNITTSLKKENQFDQNMKRMQCGFHGKDVVIMMTIG